MGRRFNAVAAKHPRASAASLVAETMLQKDLEGKTVLVTGASSGLGRACASRLAGRGAQLVLVGRNGEVLAAFLPEGAGRVLSCDLCSAEAVGGLVGRLKQDVGPIWGWVLAAGVHALRPLSMETAPSLANMWSVNLHANLVLLAAALKGRVVERSGSVVLFSSSAASRGAAAMVSYAASKGAIESVTRSLAAELAPMRVRVNAVSPGVIRTPMSESYLSRLSEEQVARLEARHPLGFGRPDDVAGVVSFLLSDDARWITGAVIAVDGGFSIG